MTEQLDGVKTYTWTWWPEDTLDCLDLLLVYLGIHEKLCREPLVAVTRFRHMPDKEANMRRALGMKSWKSAITLLYPGRCHPRPQHGVYWCAAPRIDYRARMTTAGIDIDTVQVNDIRKFGWTWAQLTEGHHPKFSITKQRKLVKGNEMPPPIGPYVKTFTMIPKSNERLVLKAALEEQRKANWAMNSAAEKGIELDPINSIGQVLSQQKKKFL